jgi:NAD(P)H-dependent flavin oxidoreductase YrpB (nitropropane dioxygenase family)
MAIGFDAFKAGTMDGDNDKGVLPLGQIAGIIKETLPVETVMKNLIAEAKKTEKRLTSILK